MNYSEAIKYTAENRVSEELRTEFIRKSIHVLIAFVPSLAAVNVVMTFFLLLTGMLLYSYAEMVRMKGGKIFVISALTMIASRKRDNGRFVLGPVTLAVGAMLALCLYPAPAAAIAIYALAFGDSLSSITGKMFGKIKIPFTNGKTLTGTVTCFLVVLFTAFAFTSDFSSAMIIAVSAAFLEALPLQDFDNIVLPLGTGAIASFFF
ncbi:MAG: phosphatidate cytidylyltransferase [Spirochaetales bacterium]|nr:phosphatidate cytidylyltransferase [Spirochaetales bacterium]